MANLNSLGFFSPDSGTKTKNIKQIVMIHKILQFDNKIQFKKKSLL